MPTIEQLAVTTSEGIGKPDYSNEVSLGRIRPGLTLKHLQSLRIIGLCCTDIFSLYPYVIAPLAPGATANLIEWATGIPTPITIPAGYFVQAIQIGHSFSEDARFQSYVDGMFGTYVGTTVSGNPFTESTVIGWSTIMIDPTGATAHTYSLVLENIGAGNLYGACTLHAIQEAIGTEPLPDTKIVRCRVCAYEHEQPNTATLVTCPECHEQTMYYNLTGIREL